jgi:hypothetical protein
VQKEQNKKKKGLECSKNGEKFIVTSEMMGWGVCVWGGAISA